MRDGENKSNEKVGWKEKLTGKEKASEMRFGLYTSVQDDHKKGEADRSTGGSSWSGYQTGLRAHLTGDEKRR